MKHASPKVSTADLHFFFEDRHSSLAAKVSAFSGSFEEDDLNVNAATIDAVKQLARSGLTDYCVPENYGGATVGQPDALDCRSLTLIRENLGWSSALLDTAFAMQGLGSYPISMVGTDEQKRTYLPGIISGERLGAFALTEPTAGSDVAAMRCRADACDGGFVLNGEKTYISNAGIAGQYVVFAKSDPDAGRRGITAFIVDAGQPGLSIEPFEVIAPHPIGRLIFKDCFVPSDKVLGELGSGFKIAMKTLDVFRTTVGGAALGLARRALDEALTQAQSRTQFGKPIIEQQQIAAYLADMKTEFDAARLLVYRAAYLKDTTSERVSQEVAIGKLYSTEAAQRIIDRAVQIFGGSGVRVGSVVERLYREVRALRIYEGTSEIQRVVIAAGLRSRD
ncbi:MAG: acyl-CoA dehydrogenase family protein [Bradymonadia bacterium]